MNVIQKSTHEIILYCNGFISGIVEKEYQSALKLNKLNDNSAKY
jgi:hypothetical protein